MSGPSEKAIRAAVEAAGGHTGNRGAYRAAKAALGASHDPALGLDRSINARDFLDEIVEALLRGRYENDTSGAWWAGFLERELGAG